VPILKKRANRIKDRHPTRWLAPPDGLTRADDTARVSILLTAAQLMDVGRNRVDLRI